VTFERFVILLLFVYLLLLFSDTESKEANDGAGFKGYCNKIVTSSDKLSIWLKVN